MHRGDEIDQEYGAIRTPIVWYESTTGNLPSALAYITSDKSQSNTTYNKWSQIENSVITVKENTYWTEQKQFAIWNWGYANKGNKIVSDESTAKTKTSSYDNIASHYSNYDNNVREEGLNPKKNSSTVNFNNTSNNECEIGEYSISYKDKYEVYNKYTAFSGISDIIITGTNDKDKNVKKNITPKAIKIYNKNEKKWYKYNLNGNDKWDFFNPSGISKIDNTAGNNINLNGKKFKLVFDNPGSNITHFSIKIKFKYMLANGKYTKYNGKKYYIETLTENNKWKLNKKSADQQDIIAVDAIRSVYEQELNLGSKKITIDNGSYNIKLKKVEEDNETKLLSGVKFTIEKSNWSSKKGKWVRESSTDKTTGTDGIIKIAENESITASNYNIPVWYRITESKEKDGYKKYTGYIDVIVSKKLDTDNGKYAVNTIVVKDSGNKLTNGNNSKPVKYTTTSSGGTTTVTVSNPKIESGTFVLNLKKIAAGTTSTKLHGAEFSIKENENDTRPNITEQKDKDGKGTGNYNLLNQSITKSGTYTYDITEVRAPTAPSACVKFTGKIKVEVKTGIGTITKNNKTTYKYIVTSINVKAFDGNNELKGNNSPVSETHTTNGDKECTINLKMTNILEGSYDLKINKISSSSKDPLSGATFKIQKATTNSSGLNWNRGTEISANDNGTYTLTGTEKVKIETKQSDYYWITEKTAPNGYKKFTGGIMVQINKEIKENTKGEQQYMVKEVITSVFENSDPTETWSTFKGKNPVTSHGNSTTLTMENDSEYDLALRKFITSINGKAPSVTRVPSIATSEVTALKNGIKTTAVKSHPKDALEVTTGDRVVYTIRIYNEGKVAGKATQITDYLPEGLKLAGNSKKGDINYDYKWKTDPEDGKKVSTDYLKNTTIPALSEKSKEVACKDVKIECIVTATSKMDLKNIAEITADDGDDRDSKPNNVNRKNYGTTRQQDDDDFELLRLKPTLQLRGTVWEDLREGKETLADGLKDGNEKGIQGIPVTLHNTSNNSTKTTNTDASGYYKFEKLDVDKAYYITFTYNGQEYENTLYRKNGKDTGSSQAYEPQAARDSLNKGLEEIDGDEGYKLEDISKYITNISKFKITAQTETYNNEKKSDENKVISGINFGITKRIEFDMKLEKDVYAATVTVNGKTQIYEYNKKDIKDSIKDSRPNYESLSEAEKEEALNNWTITVVKGDYQRAIAEPDYNFAGVNENGKLELYVTYKIAVKNQSMSMLGEVTKIKDYYDPTYTYVPELSWISSKNYSTNDLINVRKGIINSLQNSTAISEDKDMNASEVTYNSNTNNTLDIAFSGKLQSGEAKYLYLTFKVNKEKKDGIYKVITGTKAKTNKAEIAAFKSYYKKGTVLPCYNGENEYKVKNETIAGRVDRDSIPNNLNNKPKEDDEDEAPGLNVKVEGDRTITGFVWEDARNNKVDDSVIGDGVYNNKDTKIDIAKEGIKVELYRAKSEKQFELVKDAKLSVDGNKYTFSNVVAGDYIVRFTYGDGTVKYNGQDYKTTIYQDYGDSDKYNLDVSDENLSRAADLWDVRTTLNASSAANVKNEMAEKLAKGEGSKMIADTKTIVAEIEYNRQVTTENPAPGYAIKGVNLGLVERPKAQLELNKTVSNVKVTLADGSILFDASQGVNVDNVAWQQNTNKNRGLIQLSMDQEIMHGASIQITYKLTVKNVGEVDYEGQPFYYTGKNPENKVTTTPNTVVDYVSNNLQFNKDNNSNWEIVKLDELYKEENSADNYINQAVKTKAQKINTIVKTNALNTALEPGKSVDTTLVLTQVITPENKNDNLTYSNIAEIVEVSNTVGRKMAFSIVGNQDPTANTPSEIDASIAEKIVILPPFGDGNIVYYILGAVVGIILIGGITLIIKKVLIIK